MDAVRQDSFGGPNVLRLHRVPVPRPGRGEVLVEVRAIGVNPVDWKTRAGAGVLQELPFTVGWDIAGVVVDLGDGVTRFAPRDEVLGMLRFPAEAAAYAQYVVAPARELVHKPARLTYEQAAGLPLAGLTAWQILVDTADVGPGDRVLINAAGGGVGHLAVQIAKARGAHVTAVAGADKHAAIAALGADQVLDRRSEDLLASALDLDVVVDAFGGPSSSRWLPSLRPGGLLVPVTGGGAPLTDAAAGRDIRVASHLVAPDGGSLDQLATLADAGQLRVLVHTVVPLELASEAHVVGEAGRTLGKIVLVP